MLYLIWLILIFLGFIFRKNKLVSFLILSFIFILYGWSSGNADFNNYEYRYNNYAGYQNHTEIGYYYLLYLFNLLNVDFREFMIFNAVVIVACLWIFTYLIDTNTPNLIYSLYMIFPLCMSVVTMRFTLASSISMLGVAYLLNGGKKRYLFPVIAFLAGMLIHVSCAFFFVFLIADLVSEKQIRRIIKISTICLGIIVLLPSMFIEFVYRLPNISITKVLASTIITSSMLYDLIDIVVMTGQIVIILIIICYEYRLINKKMKKYKLVKDEFIIKSQNYTYCLILLIPLSVISVDCFRILMAFIIEIYAVTGYFFYLTERNHLGLKISLDRFRLGTIAFVIAFTMLFLWVLRSTNITFVFRPLFENNLLMAS